MSRNPFREYNFIQNPKSKTQNPKPKAQMSNQAQNPKSKLKKCILLTLSHLDLI